MVKDKTITEARVLVEKAKKELVQAEREHYLKVLERILNKAEEYVKAYPQVFDLESTFKIASWFEAQDETDLLAIKFFDGKPIYVTRSGRDVSTHDVREKLFSKYKIKSLVEGFYSDLFEPIGKYLAKQELNNLEAELLAE